MSGEQPRHHGQHRDPRPSPHSHQQGQRGIPDGLLVGVLAFLLGLTLLVWTATGLAGLFTHGSWPDGVTFTNTPLAMRSLVSQPHDIPAAWPTAPPEQLSGYGLFWGLLIGQFMVLVVLSVFALGTLARWRAVRASRRVRGRSADVRPVRKHTSRPGPPPAESETGSGAGIEYGDATALPAPDASRNGRPAPDDAPRPARPQALSPSAGGPDPSLACDATGPGDPAAVDRSASGASYVATGVPVSASPLVTTHRDRAADAPAARTAADVERGRVPAPSAVPVAPRVLYGDRATRHPSAVRAVHEAAGPTVVVTSDPAVWTDTKDARSKLGPVLVYDPGHLCDTPARLHWSPTTGCTDPDTATARAAALFAPVRPHSRLDEAVADTAETLLRCWLHAAAVDGRPFKQIHRWAQGNGAHEPVRILRTHPEAAAGTAGLLESALTAHAERREIAQELTARTLSCLSSIHIRDACNPNRADSLILESFANEGGTLYVVGESIEDPRTRPGAMPLLTALTSSVVERGRRVAERSSAGRLDPPLSLVLDDVAAVAPIPRLPELLRSGQERGMPTLALLRSREQGRARWPGASLSD
ncbi:type VI secretion protein [Streptomyces sp. NPDC059176]|uniref:type IV secretory system conjugative DNA transfer family protein n=1 Tax=Streptomyces sp. NPDC059176 TaxID=3346758 RepID=UPI0036B69193